MKKVYLILAILGAILPNIWVVQESLDTGNYLLYTQPAATLEGMFANRISTVFMIDLLFVVLLFLLWSWQEAKRCNIRHLGWVWACTFLLGFASGFPLFLFFRAQTQES